MQKKVWKVAVVREELVVITGNYIKAILLNQLIYWSKRVKDSNLYFLEEKKRMQLERDSDDSPLSYGWIYKKAEELSEETMLNLNEKTIRTYLKELDDMGYIAQRRNPKYKWDRTIQYRVNLTKVIEDLNRIGYHIEEYIMLLPSGNFSNSNDDNSGAIPEITSETTSETISNTSSEKEDGLDLDKNLSFEKISKLYLELSNRNKLTVNDRTAIEAVLEQGYPINEILELTKECFAGFKQKYSGDKIKSFQYVANYIFNNAKTEQEEFQNGRNSINYGKLENKGESIFNKVTERAGIDGGWTRNLECDF